MLLWNLANQLTTKNGEENICLLCDGEFNLASRRNTCKFCSRRVCDSCSVNASSANNKQERICAMCNFVLKENKKHGSLQNPTNESQVKIICNFESIVANAKDDVKFEGASVNIFAGANLLFHSPSLRFNSQEIIFIVDKSLIWSSHLIFEIDASSCSQNQKKSGDCFFRGRINIDTIDKEYKQFECCLFSSSLLFHKHFLKLNLKCENPKVSLNKLKLLSQMKSLFPNCISELGNYLLENPLEDNNFCLSKLLDSNSWLYSRLFEVINPSLLNEQNKLISQIEKIRSSNISFAQTTKEGSDKKRREKGGKRKSPRKLDFSLLPSPYASRGENSFFPSRDALESSEIVLNPSKLSSNAKADREGYTFIPLDNVPSNQLDSSEQLRKALAELVLFSGKSADCCFPCEEQLLNITPQTYLAIAQDNSASFSSSSSSSAVVGEGVLLLTSHRLIFLSSELLLRNSSLSQSISQNSFQNSSLTPSFLLCPSLTTPGMLLLSLNEVSTVYLRHKWRGEDCVVLEAANCLDNIVYSFIAERFSSSAGFGNSGEMERRKRENIHINEGISSKSIHDSIGSVHENERKEKKENGSNSNIGVSKISNKNAPQLSSPLYEDYFNQSSPPLSPPSLPPNHQSSNITNISNNSSFPHHVKSTDEFRWIRDCIFWAKLEHKFSLLSSPKSYSKQSQSPINSSSSLDVPFSLVDEYFRILNFDTSLDENSDSNSLIVGGSTKNNIKIINNLNPNWRVSEINKSFNLCPSYPHLFVVPNGVSDECVSGAAKQRSVGRLPAMTWIHPKTGAAICRASQPIIGMTDVSRPEDEKLLIAFRDAANSHYMSKLNKKKKKKSSKNNQDGVNESYSYSNLASPSPQTLNQMNGQLATSESDFSFNEVGLCLSAEDSSWTDISHSHNNSHKVSNSHTPSPPPVTALIINDRNGNHVADRCQTKLRILDCRPVYSAHGNSLMGKGFESLNRLGGKDKASIQFAGIQNIHSMRESYRTLRTHLLKLSLRAHARLISDSFVSENPDQSLSGGEAAMPLFPKSMKTAKSNSNASLTNAPSVQPLSRAISPSLTRVNSPSLSNINNTNNINNNNNNNISLAKEAAAMALCKAEVEKDIKDKEKDRNKEERTRGASSHYSRNADSSLYLQALYDSKWIQHISDILQASEYVADQVIAGHACLVHCSDGWDRTSQVCALAELLMDPFYRSLAGFRALVEKDFAHFGHRFRTRLGATNSSVISCGASTASNTTEEALGAEAEGKYKEASPVFLQFLDCVYQIFRQNVSAFEFNENFLVFLALHHKTGFAKEFSHDSIKEYQHDNNDNRNMDKFKENKGFHSSNVSNLKMSEKCSLWDVVSCNQHKFINCLYRKENEKVSIKAKVSAKTNNAKQTKNENELSEKDKETENEWDDCNEWMEKDKTIRGLDPIQNESLGLIGNAEDTDDGDIGDDIENENDKYSELLNERLTVNTLGSSLQLWQLHFIGLFLPCSTSSLSATYSSLNFGSFQGATSDREAWAESLEFDPMGFRGFAYSICSLLREKEKEISDLKRALKNLAGSKENVMEASTDGRVFQEAMLRDGYF